MTSPMPVYFGDDQQKIAWSLQESSKQISRLFQDGDIIELRAIGSGENAQHVYSTVCNYPINHGRLIELNDRGFNIYFGVLPRRAVGGTNSEDVVAGKALCVDKDGIDATTLLADIENAGLPRPAITIASGGGGQAFWVASAGIEPDEWVALQAGTIAAVAGADSNCKDKPRLMRLAGFRNCKPGYAPDYPLARIVDYQGEGVVDVTNWPRGHAFSSYSNETSSFDVPDGYLSTKATAFLERGELYQATGGGEPSRRATAFAVACEAKASNIPIEEITEKITATLARLGISGPDLDDVERQIQNAYSRERSPYVGPEDKGRVVFPVAKPKFSICKDGKDKIAVTVRFGAKSFTDRINPKNADERRRLLKYSQEMCGETHNLSELASQLERIAAGDLVVEPPPDTDAVSASAEEVDGYLVVRPERLFVLGQTEDLSAITVPVRVLSADGIEPVWRTYIRRGEKRQCVPLPESVDVDGTTYFVSPEPSSPGQSMLDGWSKLSRQKWLVTGEDVIPPADLIAELSATFAEFIEIPDGQADAVYQLLALFSVLSYNSPAFTAVPYLAINGPAGAGKTRVLDCLKQTVFRPLSVSSTSAAAVFRQLNNRGGCLLFDEAEQLNTAEMGHTGDLYPCLLAGYKRDGVAARCDGEDNEPREFSVYGPKVLTSIRELPETLASRCITIIMCRSRRGSKKALKSPDDPKCAGMWQRLRDALHCFSINRGSQMLQLPEADAVVPGEMFPRSREIWAPILQLARLFEDEGAAGLLARMQEFAGAKAAVAEQLLVPDLDAAVLKAAMYLSLPGASKPPTAGEIATRAQMADPGAAPSVSAKHAGSILRRYGLTPRQVGGRSHFEMQPNFAAEISERYGIPLEFADASGKPAPSVTAPTPPNPPPQPSEGDVGGMSTGNPAPKNTDGIKVTPREVVL